MKAGRPNISDEAIYAVVAARRAGFDSMAWQVPIISLTAQAFLFTIALAPDTLIFGRLVASGLIVVAALLSMILLARHRQADVADAEWLATMERNRTQDLDMEVHGQIWRARRDEADIHPLFNWMKFARAFVIWEFGLLLFGLAGVAIFVIALVAPDLLVAALPADPSPSLS